MNRVLNINILIFELFIEIKIMDWNKYITPKTMQQIQYYVSRSWGGMILFSMTGLLIGMYYRLFIKVF